MSTSTTRGLTTIEIIVTTSVFMALTSMTVATLSPFLMRGRIAEGTAIIDAANQEARMRARAEPVARDRFYGVRLVGDETPNVVEVIRADAGAVTVLQRRPLSRQTQLYAGDSPLSSDLTWYVQPRTGYPIAQPSATAPVAAVGAAAPGSPQHLSLRARTGRSRYAVAVYEIGIVHAEEF